MTRKSCLRSFVLLSLLALAGCASQTPPPAAAPPPAPSTAPAPVPIQPFFSQSGTASFYGAAHEGKTTANGEKFDPAAFTAAHLTLAFGTVVRVTNLSNGKMVKVAINDRGPVTKGRIIDLSSAAARVLDMEDSGIAKVRLEVFRDDQQAMESE